jgi:serine/threonine protein kinase
MEPRKLFTARDDDGDLYDAAHLAQLIAALGPPPPDYLAKNPERRADFWDEHGMSTSERSMRVEGAFWTLLMSGDYLLTILIGNWLGLAPIPHGRTMEALESRLENKSSFLRFIRRAVTWTPGERATAKELLQDPWLTGDASRNYVR